MAASGDLRLQSIDRLKLNEIGHGESSGGDFRDLGRTAWKYRSMRDRSRRSTQCEAVHQK